MAAAFRAEHGLQCGFCTPGMVMAAVGLLSENPKPTEREVREGLEGNLCRCTGYHNIVRAVIAASGQDPDEVQGAAIHRVTDAGGVEAAAGFSSGDSAGRRMIPVGFDYERPDSLDAALALLAEHGDDAKVLAGGHSLLPVMKLRLAAPELLIDIGRLASCATCASTATSSPSARAPATTTSRRPTCVAAEAPLLGAVARTVGDPQVRHRGTLGGSLAHADPASDLPAAVLALGRRRS